MESFGNHYLETLIVKMQTIAIGKRFTSGMGILYLMFIALLIVFYFIAKTVGAVIWKFMTGLANLLFYKFCHDEQWNDVKLQVALKMRQNHSGADTFSEDFFADLRIGALKDLYEKSKDELVEYNLFI